MTAAEMIATAAHLHVAMRRKMGRVTDVEWMVTDVAYATAMTQLALQHATDQNDEDLRKWSSKLAQAWADKAPAPPKSAAVVQRLAEPHPARYVVGLRC